VLVLASATGNLNCLLMVYLPDPYFFRKKMSAPAPMQRSITGTQPETESDSDGEDFSDAPDMREYNAAMNALAAIKAESKDHRETLKRKADELEDFMIDKGIKFIRIEGLVAQIKKRKKLSWNEKSLREHVNAEGMLDLDMYKSNQTEVVERMTIKLEN